MIKKLLFALVATATLAACKDGEGLRPSASGTSYDVLVVMDDAQWRAPIGQMLDSVLTASIAGLPQPEPFAVVSHVAEGNLTSGMKYFRNILYVEVDPLTVTRVSLHFTRDANASGQYIFTLRAPSTDALGDYLSEAGDQLRDVINQSEIRRKVKSYKRNYSPEFYNRVLARFDCRLKGPKDFTNYREREDFIWATSYNQQMNMVVYSYPYEGPETFNFDYVVAKRDSVMKQHVKHSDDDYMRTDTMRTDVVALNVKGDYCMEMRGVWEMSKSWLACPFVSHSRVDTVNNRVIVVEGFVNEVEHRNRYMMHALEAALWTLDLPGATENGEQRTEEDEGEE